MRRSHVTNRVPNRLEDQVDGWINKPVVAMVVIIVIVRRVATLVESDSKHVECHGKVEDPNKEEDKESSHLKDRLRDHEHELTSAFWYTQVKHYFQEAKRDNQEAQEGQRIKVSWWDTLIDCFFRKIRMTREALMGHFDIGVMDSEHAVNQHSDYLQDVKLIPETFEVRFRSLSDLIPFCQKQHKHSKDAGSAQQADKPYVLCEEQLDAERNNVEEEEEKELAVVERSGALELIVDQVADNTLLLYFIFVVEIHDIAH